jgi:PAS domain S-box-containing protein
MPQENNNAVMSGNAFKNSYFKGLAETIPQFILIVDAIDYRVEYINRFQPSSVLKEPTGMNMFDFVWPEHVELFRQKVDEIKISGKTSIVEVMGASSRYSDGKAWYRAQISTVPGSDSSIKSLILIVEDITETKAQEFENINKNERIKSIINNTRDIICSIDEEYNLVEFNSVFAKMVKKGYDIDMQPGMPVLQFTDPAKHEHLKEIYKIVLNGDSLTDIQNFNTVNGHQVYNETNYNPIYNAEKKVSGITIFSKDITERIKSEKKIKSALKEKEALLAEIHHRIKNNLAMVSSLLQLQEINTDNKEVKEALSLSRKRIKSTALIHELLYKNESFQNIDLNDYIMELFQHFKINENIQLHLNGDKVALNLSVAMPLGLMLNEIMLNSFKHSYTDHSKGQIEIITTALATGLTIEYNDFEGRFSPSVDFKNSNTTGLTLIHTFAEQLNGSIELVDKAPPKYKIQIALDENI